MQKFSVTGMSCAACAARVEKAVLKVPGVSSCAVSLLTNSMGVEGAAGAEEIVAAVREAGYGASPAGAKKAESQEGRASAESGLENSEAKSLAKRLAASVLVLLLLMYFSMAHPMWGAPLPPFFAENLAAQALMQMILSFAVILINRKFFSSGFKSLLHRAPNMDALVALGSGVSFAYSTAVLFAMTDALSKGDSARLSACAGNLYFEGAAMILTLIGVGKLLESVSKGRTTDALKSLMSLAPERAAVVREGRELSVPLSEVREGDVFVVRPGERIPVDGIVLEGSSAVNEAAVTGESLPVDKAEGAQVISATMNMNGFLKCRATRVGEDTTLSSIIRLVSDAAATKAPIAKIADRVSGVFVPAVIAIAAATLAAWLLSGAEFSFALSRSISVLVISCPCALGLATPVAIMVGSGVGARNGILFKTSESLEALGKIRAVALDKTGTITSGKMSVTDVLPAQGFGRDEFLALAASLEAKSEHPVAKAVIREFGKMEFMDAEDFSALPGRGLSARIGGMKVCGGNAQFIEGILKDSPACKTEGSRLLEEAQRLSGEGKTPLLFAREGEPLGLVAVADGLKEDSVRAVRELKRLGLRAVMVTGDNERTARAVGAAAGADEIVAGVLPEGKAEAVARLKSLGGVAMAGDGINDAPALAAADVGIAIGAGTDIAIDAADVVLMRSSLMDVARAVALSRMTLRNIKQNLFWAFFYNAAGIPLAAGAYYHAFGLSLSPMFAAAAMSLSSFCVVSNALRLNLASLRLKKMGSENSACERAEEIDSNSTEEQRMIERTIKVEGMMCSNCERHVREALEKVEGVAEAAPSCKTGEVALKLSAEVDAAKISAAVEAAGYKVAG